LPGLRNLNLGASAIGDSGLRHIVSLPTIENLYLPPSITPAGLATLSHLSKPVALELQTTLNDDDFKYMSEVKLISLTLLAGPMTGDGLSHLKHLDRLTKLQMYRGSALEPRLLDHIRSITSLQTLSLKDSRLSDEVLVRLAELADLSELRVFILDGCGLKNEHLEQLRGLTQLTRLSLSGNELSPEAVAALRKDLPDCRVEFSR
jgi:Leucine-rich repeat (LRR) protein